MGPERPPGTGVLDASYAKRLVARTDRRLTGEQAEALRATVADGHGVSVIEALAGTGKTHTAGALRELYESAGYEVLGVAPTARATRELSERAGIRARTLDRLLLDLEELGDELPQRCVLVLDEAGMAATRPSARLLEAAEDASAKVIAIGDPGQLASVQAGGWLGAIARELGSARLTEVMRQRDPSERRALAALHERLPRRYLDWAERAGRIGTFGERADACKRAVVEWGSAAADLGAAQAVMIARDNETRACLNDAARELRRALGLLGEERSFGSIELAVGDRVICRRNDHAIDVDNGMRGSVRHLDGDRVLIDTDSGLVRELPAAYVSEHLEHAYCLTGHGMQGATVERAFVVASPHDLTAGWSYTALSRARGETRLLIYECQPAKERCELAPSERTPSVARGDLIARLERRMLARDDEELAIEQLASAGRADDHELAASRALASEPLQERAADRAQPEAPAARTPTRLRELRDQIQRLQAQFQALPTHQLKRVEHFEERALALSTEREQLAEELSHLPEPRRRFGREHDPHAIERAHLSSALEAYDRELRTVQTHRTGLERELGDPAEIRAERDGLERAIGRSTRELTEVRDQLAERELCEPAPWVRESFGERPDEPWAREQWEKAVLSVARYRAEYEISCANDALGPQPEQDEQRHDWEHAREAMGHAELRLGRDAGLEHEIDLGMGF
jgi:AAA domain